MSKNISIKEVGVAQNISGVTHIKVPDIESSDIDFVPEDDLLTRFKVITANGTYLPASDLGDGYVAVLVDVPVKSVKGKDKKTGKINTVTVNPETGEIEKTEQSTEPAGIHIVVPPTKKDYTDGDTIDFTGIHVYLVDEDNHPWISDEYPTGEIPFDELTFPVTTASGSSSGSHVPSDNPYETGAFSYFIAPATLKRYTGTPTVLSADKTLKIALKQDDNVFTVASYDASVSVTATPTEDTPITVSISLTSYTKDNKTAYYNKVSFNYVDPDESRSLFTQYSRSNSEGLIAWIMLYGNYDGSETEVPVQWSKDGGQVFEDTFTINVASAGGAPSGESSSGGEHSSGDF